MSQLILILHILVAIAMITLILMQHGKGADAGATFGSGASSTMFGSVGAVPFLMKITALLAVIFFATSITLSYFTSYAEKQSTSLFKGMPTMQAPANAPAPAKSSVKPVQPAKKSSTTPSALPASVTTVTTPAPDKTGKSQQPTETKALKDSKDPKEVKELKK